jgi:phosphomethylpyrimidine synthase
MGIGGVNITLHSRKYAAQNLSEEEALKKGMEEKSKEFAEQGAELYTKDKLTCRLLF